MSDIIIKIINPSKGKIKVSDKERKENEKIGVWVKHTSDFPQDFVLTNTYIPNTLERVAKISELAILNHTTIPVSLIDANGVISKHRPINIDATFINLVGITHENKYVYLVERRLVDNDDLVNSIVFNNSRKSKGELYNIIHDKLPNLKDGRKTNEVYVIYQIDAEYLSLNRAITIKELGLTISLVGYEKLPDGHHHYGLDREMTVSSDKIFTSNIVYYHNDPNECIYINLLNKTIRIDSIPIESEIEGEGVMMLTNGATGIDRVLIKPKDFKKHNIYQTVREAKASMSKEEILVNRKLDIEMMSIESKLICSLSNDMSNTYKSKMDMINKKNQVLAEMDKVKTAKRNEKSMSAMLDTAKKYADVISMIKKLVFP